MAHLSVVPVPKLYTWANWLIRRIYETPPVGLFRNQLNTFAALALFSYGYGMGMSIFTGDNCSCKQMSGD